MHKLGHCIIMTFSKTYSLGALKLYVVNVTRSKLTRQICESKYVNNLDNFTEIMKLEMLWGHSKHCEN